MWATCRVDGCENSGIPIDMGDLTMKDPDTGEPILDGDGNPVMMGVTCGPCGEPITDLAADEPPHVEHRE